MPDVRVDLPERPRPPLLLISLGLGFLLLCVACYVAALHGPLFFDDIPNLLDNRLMQIGGREFDDWRVAIVSNNSGPLLRPVAMLTFTLNYVLAGDFSPVVFKGTNLAIHLLIGVLFYLLCRALLRSPALADTVPADPRMVAMVAAALWLLHPLHVSTVLYVVQRMAQLSTLFTLLGLLVFCRYRLRWAHRGASAGDVVAAGLWLVLITLAAALSKENGLLLPWLVVVLEVTLFRGEWAGRRSTVLARLGWLALVLPLLLVPILLLVSPELVLGKYAGREFSLEERVLTQSRILWRYLGWILLPNITSMGFFHDDIPLSRGLFSPLTTGLSILAWGGVTMAALRLRRHYPLLLFALLFYFVGHAMESTIVALEMVFEHRNYLPSMGVLLLAAAALFQLAGRVPRLRPRVFLLVAIIVLSVQLHLRAQAWQDPMSLARFNVVNHPASPRANFYYGMTLFDRLGRAGELGLDAEEQKALAVSSRAHFLQMYKLAPKDIPAIVMLYQLDTLNFPALAEDNDWLGKVAELAQTKRISASDRGALAALIAFSRTPPGEPELSRVESILNRLVERYPRSLDLVTLHYRVMASKPDADHDALREHLLQAASRRDGNRLLYAYLVQRYGADDLAMTYDVIGAWMRQDPGRRELAVVRRLFEQ